MSFTKQTLSELYCYAKGRFNTSEVELSNIHFTTEYQLLWSKYKIKTGLKDQGFSFSKENMTALI